MKEESIKSRFIGKDIKVLAITPDVSYGRNLRVWKIYSIALNIQERILEVVKTIIQSD